MSVLVLVEHDGGEADELSLQALALARDLGEPAALLVGGREAATQLGAHGVSTAYVAEHEGLAAYAPAAWARCVDEVMARIEARDLVVSGYGIREGILLGCTEIDLLIGPPDAPLPVFDTTRLHAERAVDLALAT